MRKLLALVIGVSLFTSCELALSSDSTEYDSSDTRGVVGAAIGSITELVDGQVANMLKLPDSQKGKAMDIFMGEVTRALNGSISNSEKLIAGWEAQLKIAKSINPKEAATLSKSIIEQTKKLKSSVKNLRNQASIAATFKVAKAAGNIINIYELGDSLISAAKEIDATNKLSFDAGLKVAEKVVSFNPLAGATIFAKDEIDKALTISRDIGDQYANTIQSVADRYFQQYHILMDMVVNGRSDSDIQDRIALFKNQRIEMYSALNNIRSEINDGFTFFGKNNALSSIDGVLGVLEKDIETKQLRFVQQAKIKVEKKNELILNFNKMAQDAKNYGTTLLNDMNLSSKEISFKPPEIKIEQGAVSEVKAFAGSLIEPEARLNAVNMNSYTAAVTGSNFSAVGSSARYFKGTSAADRTAYNNLKVAELKKQTVQEGSTYVNGQIIKAPVDVVLRWGANPSDLDSHLTGPTGNPNNANERFHTFYGQPGSLDSAPNAMLYRDDTDSFGPEQTRINVVNPGVYRFYVHDYSNRHSTGSTALSNSGAAVTIHQSGSTSLPEGQNLGAQVAQVNVPTGRTGNTWQAFELDSRTGVLNRTTEFRDVSNPVNVPFNQ